jgi:hypothetical protein
VKSRVERYLTDLDSLLKLFFQKSVRAALSPIFFGVNCTAAAESGLSEGIVNPDQGY